MAQKYKVFLDTHYIIFSDTDENLPNWRGAYPKSIRELSIALASQNWQFRASKPRAAMQTFFKHFKFNRTAGGLVQRETDDAYLWIYRFEHLDLPKGKIEKGEGLIQAAVREIEEETGLKGHFEHLESLPCTYHVYEMSKQSYFKENHWFRFRFTGISDLKPQLEEGIESVFWLSAKEWKGRLNETYSGLREMLHSAC
jgi:8-oxo-dGTP pyrophosphatase MutT (NUDIX family)